MSKNYKNIDQLFNEELGSMQAKAPAHVKENIDKAIGRKKKGIFFYLIPTLLILLAIPAVYYATQNGSNQTPEGDYQPRDNSTSTNLNQDEPPHLDNDLVETEDVSNEIAVDHSSVSSETNTETNGNENPVETVETWTFKIDTSKLNDSLLFDDLDDDDQKEEEEFEPENY